MMQDNNAKNSNMAARLWLSDGTSKLVCMFPKKVYQAMVVKGLDIRNLNVWVINAGQQLMQEIQKRPVMIMKTIPKVFGDHVDKIIGEPHDYVKNKQSENFPSDLDLSIPISQKEEEIKLDEELTFTANKQEEPIEERKS